MVWRDEVVHMGGVTREGVWCGGVKRKTGEQEHDKAATSTTSAFVAA